MRRQQRNPFPLALEPLTKTSLAKYVATEMPAEPPQPAERIQEIVDRATNATGGLPINRVGVLYDTLVKIFEDETKLADSDLRPETADTFQAGPEDWFAFFGRLVIRVVRCRADAVDALRAIGEQGEGSASPPPEDPSHFDLFLEIYRAFPETDAALGPITWTPVRSVPSNPSTLRHPSAETAVERSRITHPTTRLWAQLFNVRYRMLLVDLAHALHVSGPLEENGGLTVRGHLRDWTFAEMRGEGSGAAGLRGIAKTLMALPLNRRLARPTPPTPARRSSFRTPSRCRTTSVTAGVSTSLCWTSHGG
ncbi:MAG: ferritin-like domain-containing protein [Egibacteraceae bacterium]